MIWNQVRGHQTQIEMFRQSIRTGRFSQAYLLLGPDGIGKRLFAKTLAQCLFCEEYPDQELNACGLCASCRQIQAGSHPDLLMLGCPEGKNVFPIELIAGRKEHRGREGFCYDITLRPMSAKRRIAILDDANLMNAEAANALLKTLEEPPSFATLFLLSPQPEALLPTIQSRCQAVQFSPLLDEAVAELLLEQNLVETQTEAVSIAALSEGSLTLAKQLLNPELRQLREGLFNGLLQPRYNPIELSKALLEGIEELGGDSHEKRQNAGWLARFAIEFFRRALLLLTGPKHDSPIPQVARFANRFDANLCEDIEMVMACLDVCVSAERQLQRNVPASMVFENLFQELGRVFRSLVQSTK